MWRIALVAVFAAVLVPAHAQSKGSVRELQLSPKKHVAERKVITTKYHDMLFRKLDVKAPVEVFIAVVDLNNDGRKDIVAQFVGSPTCGTAGCSTLVLVARKDGDWDEVLNHVNTHAIYIGSSGQNQYRPLYLTGKRGRSKWEFDGKKYECSNPCVQGTPASGRP